MEEMNGSRVGTDNSMFCIQQNQRFLHIAGDFVNDNTLTVYIKRLREKVEEDPKNPEIIKTVRGLGYKVDA